MSRGTELSAKETPRACELRTHDIRQKDETVVSEDTVVSDETVVSANDNDSGDEDWEQWQIEAQ